MPDKWRCWDVCLQLRYPAILDSKRLVDNQLLQNNGDNIWKTVAGIDSQTQWIWDGATGTDKHCCSFKATVSSGFSTRIRFIFAGLGLVGFIVVKD